MNKILAGVLFGIGLGLLDGATAWFTPEVRPAIGGILVGSSIKGMLVGILCGWFARKVDSTGWGIALGAGLGFLLALAVAMMQGNNYLEILLPGFVTGAIIGFLTQRTGTRPVAERARA